jgi:hypothetical protein
LTRTQEIWTGSAWSNASREVYTYGTTYLDYIVEQIWNISAWENVNKLDYTINPSGRVTDLTWQQWSDSIWVNYVFYNVSYQGTRQTEILIQLWENEAWANVYRTLNVYAVPVAIRNMRKNPALRDLGFGGNSGRIEIRDALGRSRFFDLRGKVLQ